MAHALPAKESGPAASMICWATTRDPLPETGRSRMREISSSEMPSFSKKGLVVSWRNPMAPEEVRAPMARKMPSKKGRISTLVLRPSLAPLIKASYMGTFFQIP